jgi:hypothetical protein
MNIPLGSTCQSTLQILWLWLEHPSPPASNEYLNVEVFGDALPFSELRVKKYPHFQLIEFRIDTSLHLKVSSILLIPCHS